MDASYQFRAFFFKKKTREIASYPVRAFSFHKIIVNKCCIAGDEIINASYELAQNNL